MTPDDLIQHFGGLTAAARALGVKPPSVSGWKSAGRIPSVRQYQIEVLTGGSLRAERGDDAVDSGEDDDSPADVNGSSSRGER